MVEYFSFCIICKYSARLAKADKEELIFSQCSGPCSTLPSPICRCNSAECPLLCPPLAQQLRCSIASPPAAWLSFPHKLLICALSFFLFRICCLGFLMFLIPQAVCPPLKYWDLCRVCSTSIFCSGNFLYMRAGICLPLPAFYPFFSTLKHFFSVCFLAFAGPANQKNEIKLHKCILRKMFIQPWCLADSMA